MEKRLSEFSIGETGVIRLVGGVSSVEGRTSCRSLSVMMWSTAMGEGAMMPIV